MKGKTPIQSIFPFELGHVHIKMSPKKIEANEKVMETECESIEDPPVIVHLYLDRIATSLDHLLELCVKAKKHLRSFNFQCRAPRSSPDCMGWKSNMNHITTNKCVSAWEKNEPQSHSVI